MVYLVHVVFNNFMQSNLSVDVSIVYNFPFSFCHFFLLVVCSYTSNFFLIAVESVFVLQYNIVIQYFYGIGFI